MTSCAHCGHLETWHTVSGCAGLVGFVDGTIPLREPCTCVEFVKAPADWPGLAVLGIVATVLVILALVTLT